MVNTLEQTKTGALTTWAIDPAHTVVEFQAKHMMISTVKGRFPEVDGAIKADLDNIENSSAEITIKAATIDSRNEQRDTHLRSGDFLDVENFPTVTFRTKSIEKIDDTHLKVRGDLTVRGTTRDVSLDTEVNGFAKSPWGQEVVALTATTEINRKDFGLTWNVALEAGGVLVSDKVKFAIELEAVKQA
ncbi:MAG TPA: polyisoprenoid-binding protein [Chloroflexi bacterium]|jgi:polyisoprenoid-binding protein YceI|nr:polyisoprenoid-binding protein [Chloroflexota bacterium]